MSGASRVAAIWLLGGVVWSCGGVAPPPAGEIARVGELPISHDSWAEHLERQVGSGSTGLDSRVLSRLLDQLVDEHVLLRFAVDEGWVEPGTGRTEALPTILARIGEVEITAEQVEEWVERNRHQLHLPDRVRLLHVFRAERDRAEQILAHFETFGVASWLAENEGDEQITELAVDDLPDRFAPVVEDLSGERRGAVVEVPEGHHVLWLEARVAGRSLSRLEMGERAHRELRRRHASRRLEEVVLAGRDRYNARVWPTNLPFDYEGAYRDAVLD